MLLEFSPLLRLQPTAEHNLTTALTRGRQQSQVSYRCDRWTDKRMAFQLYIYRLPYYMIPLQWEEWSLFIICGMCPAIN